MSNDIRQLNLDDSLQHMRDEIIKGGRSRAHSSRVTQKSVGDTEIIVRNEFGKILGKYTNKITVGGKLFILEKAFNVNAPIKIDTLNTDLDINENETAYTDGGRRRDDALWLFGVGKGGSGDTYGSIVPVRDRDKDIVDLIPMRIRPTAEDLTVAEREIYFMRDAKPDYIRYYLKRFEQKPVIKALFETDDGAITDVPKDVYSMDDDRIINIFAQMQLKINDVDTREYFKLEEQIESARINSLGLFTGYPEEITDPLDPTSKYTDYKGVTLATKLNFNNEPLDAFAKELHITYRIYI